MPFPAKDAVTLGSSICEQNDYPCAQGEQRYSKNPEAHPHVLLSNRTVIISTSISSGIPYGHARITWVTGMQSWYNIYAYLSVCT